MAARLAQVDGAEYTAMLGLGVYRPGRVVTNDEVAGPINSSDEWIRTRSGIRTRRFASEEETVIAMSVAAARDALESAGITADQVDCVIVATSSWLLLTPAAAPQIATELGMNHPAAFDISAGCAGFCHALTLASDLVKGGTAGHVLVIGVERLTDTINPADRGTAFLFADGAGAVVVGPSDEPGIGPTVWGSDGTQHHAIRQDKNWIEFFREVEEQGADAVRPYLAMEGTAVFRWAAHSLKKVCLEAIERAGLSPSDLDAMVPHQANGRIIEIMARELRLAESCALAEDIEEAGNTSAASIPLAMEALLRKGETKPGADALLVAFGAGLSYAAQVVKLPNWQ
ncbi:ketoacyl-ACP synthase III [Nocardia terpenica]|uniref:beta-ketoacyl-ACP synthase III n=1 Tax=Nocardia terpenica TaxID=455432 RepID=UPI0018931864|nr:beta-ketoacyl-ACP synthase III [Nocardia terpenica]MBF6062641.1 ketoacyl-ACP synthase III [Nocardia terpenica]MBF6105224.1 ketoacyl-ACP synthase III [Nocardia terpenica]MBF6112339.1 ketoacyl-ACP synthase III [Nocardia terpenica]MBF6118952.1 ketoacyl-ACP synthase III [Nocardia terpenica]MBF6154421.1 ketoacyl-ACP synthase III [Nocardia terpenica]